MSRMIQYQKSPKFHLYGVWKCDFNLYGLNDNAKSELDSTG